MHCRGLDRSIDRARHAMPSATWLAATCLLQTLATTRAMATAWAAEAWAARAAAPRATWMYVEEEDACAWKRKPRARVAHRAVALPTEAGAVAGPDGAPCVHTAGGSGSRLNTRPCDRLGASCATLTLSSPLPIGASLCFLCLHASFPAARCDACAPPTASAHTRLSAGTRSTPAVLRLRLPTSGR